MYDVQLVNAISASTTESSDRRLSGPAALTWERQLIRLDGSRACHVRLFELFNMTKMEKRLSLSGHPECRWKLLGPQMIDAARGATPTFGKILDGEEGRHISNQQFQASDSNVAADHEIFCEKILSTSKNCVCSFHDSAQMAANSSLGLAFIALAIRCRSL